MEALMSRQDAMHLVQLKIEHHETMMDLAASEDMEIAVEMHKMERDKWMNVSLKLCQVHTDKLIRMSPAS